MIKKFLSLIALSATLISPALADEFVPLEYYQDNPIPIIKVRSFSYSNNPINNDIDISSQKISQQIIIDCKIRQGIVDDDITIVERYADRSSLRPETINEIISAMKAHDLKDALNPFDEETSIDCDTVLNSNDEEEYYAGPGGRRSPFDPSVKKIDDAYDYNKNARKYIDEIGSFKDGNKYKKPISDSGKNKATDIPSWANGKRPYTWENGKNYAQRLMDEKYGKGNWKKSSQEYNKLKKHGDRGYE